MKEIQKKIEKPESTKKSSPPMLTGKVISDKMDKTISVLTIRRIKHEKYGKYIQKRSVFKAHDEKNKARNGDFVLLSGSRPLSKTKRWKLKRILEESKSELAPPKEIVSLEKESSEVFLKKTSLKKENKKPNEQLSEKPQGESDKVFSEKLHETSHQHQEESIEQKNEPLTASSKQQQEQEQEQEKKQEEEKQEEGQKEAVAVESETNSKTNKEDLRKE